MEARAVGEKNIAYSFCKPGLRKSYNSANGAPWQFDDYSFFYNGGSRRDANVYGKARGLPVAGK